MIAHHPQAHRRQLVFIRFIPTVVLQAAFTIFWAILIPTNTLSLYILALREYHRLITILLFLCYWPLFSVFPPNAKLSYRFF